MTSAKFAELRALALSRIGATITPHAEPDTRQLSQYWRDRTDMASVPDVRRWR